MDFENLRDYQKDCVERLRDGIREGNKSQVLVAPTGSGKTVISSFLLGEAYEKRSRSFFICDRVSLVDQTSATLDLYGVPHGVIQADHWRNRPWEPIQVVSAQTLARRDITHAPSLVIWDECHALYKSVTDYCESSNAKVIGLTATPFTKGMGRLFTNVINSTTTNRLIDQGWLVPMKIYAAKEIDMTGAELKFDGEWKEEEIQKRGLEIIGDVVSEWQQKTNQYFNGPAKTIAFSASVAHGDDLCREFQKKGFNFQQISYKDGNSERRRALIDEFRKPDSEIVGLVSCEALAKGFDVTDIKIGIGARPYRKSLSGHIQQMGRVMRSHPGKEFALWLDHSGNVLRFLSETQDVFENGVSELNDGKYDGKVRKEKTEDEKKKSSCFACGFVHTLPICPACGVARPNRGHRIVEKSGVLRELILGTRKEKPHEWMADKKRVWGELCCLSYEIKQNDFQAEKFALAQYRNLYGVWPQNKYSHELMQEPRNEVRNKVRSNLIAYRHRMTKQGAR